MLANIRIDFVVFASASEMTYIVSSGALNSTHSLVVFANAIILRRHWLFWVYWQPYHGQSSVRSDVISDTVDI